MIVFILIFYHINIIFAIKIIIRRLNFILCYATIIENILSEGLLLPNFTRDAIIRSFLGLLNEKPVNHITVKDIVEDCGINRNSFCVSVKYNVSIQAFYEMISASYNP